MAIQIRHCIKQSQAEHLCLLIERWADARVAFNTCVQSDDEEGIEETSAQVKGAYQRMLQMIISITEKE